MRRDWTAYAFWLAFVKTAIKLAESIKDHDPEGYHFQKRVGYELLSKICKHCEIHASTWVNQSVLDKASFCSFFFEGHSGGKFYIFIVRSYHTTTKLVLQVRRIKNPAPRPLQGLVRASSGTLSAGAGESANILHSGTIPVSSREEERKEEPSTYPL